MSKRGYSSLIWGGLLIVLGLVLLADNLELLGDWNAPVWSLILGAFSLVFLFTFVRDRKQWWALIPGLTILCIAVAVFLAEQELVAGHVVATIILAGVGLPFLLIFVSDRRHWWALIPGMTMCAAAAGVFFEGAGTISGEAVGGIIVGGISLGFLSIYLIDRRQWWALFPGGVMATVAFFLLLAAASEIILPAAVILVGLLLLRNALGGGRRRTRRAPRPSVPKTPPVKAVEPEQQRLPTLKEQIEVAIAKESGVVDENEVEEAKTERPESPDDMPSAPEM